MKPFYLAALLLSPLGLSAPIAAQAGDHAPVDAKGEFESIQDYLLARYDADKDGRITSAEYKRSEEAFKRLDRNKDGVLSAEDFVRPSRSGSGPGPMSSRMAMRFVAWYFQGDEDPNKLPLKELKASLEAYDTDEDGTISHEEFDCGIPLRSKLGQKPSGMAARMLKGKDPFESLLAAADKDKNGELARTEVLAFFKANDSNDDGVWDLSSFSGSRSPTGAGSRPVSGPAVGSLAPDFELSALDGDEQVKLSDFRSKKPVALIFGSYT